MTIKITDSKKRHGNCVPFVVQNTKTGVIFYSGSLNEVSAKLKISAEILSDAHRHNRVVKNKYIVKRLGFSSNIQFV